MIKFEIMEAPVNNTSSSMIDETDILYKTSVNWTAFVIPGFIALISGAATLVFFISFLRLLALPFAFIFYKAMKAFISGYTAKIMVTPRVLTIRSGIFTKKTVDISLKKYEAIALSQGIMGQIFNFGMLTVSTGEITKTYKVNAPKELRKAIIQAKKEKY